MSSRVEGRNAWVECGNSNVGVGTTVSDGGGGAVFGSGGAVGKTRSMSAQDHVGFGSVPKTVGGPVSVARV